MIARRSMNSGAVGTIVILALLATVSPASAQSTYWGVAASVTPTWRSLDNVKVVFNADAIDLSGSAFRVGFARGRTYSGHWGVSFVRKSVDSGGAITRDGDRLVLGDDVALIGVEAEKFAVFSTIKDRAQIGLIVAGGVARIDGTAIDPTGQRFPAKEALALAGEAQISPLFRLELAGAVIVTEGFKIRVSGGLDWPGLSKFTIGGVFFFGER